MTKGLENQTPPKDRILKSCDLDLVPFRLEDVDETYQGGVTDEEVTRYLEVRFADRFISTLRDYVQSVLDDPKRNFYRLIHRASNRPIGTASLAINVSHATAAWGYLVGERDFWYPGISYQAQVPLFDLAFDELGVRRFFGGPYGDNVRSQFNLRRLGFKKKGVFRAHYRKAPDSDEFVDVVYYGLMAEEWQAIRDRFEPLRYHGDEIG